MLHRFLFLSAVVILGIATAQGGVIAAEPITCSIYPAMPNGLTGLLDKGCSTNRTGEIIALSNDYLSAEISAKDGIITAVINKLTGERCRLNDDQAGVVLIGTDGGKIECMARSGGEPRFTVSLRNEPEGSMVRLSKTIEPYAITITYSLRREEFWVERRVAVGNAQLNAHPDIKFDKLVYGKLDIGAKDVRVMELGAFDRPRIISQRAGGLFGGVSWWFYTVDENGVY